MIVEENDKKWKIYFFPGSPPGMCGMPGQGVISRFPAKRAENDSAAHEFCGDFAWQNPWSGARDIEDRMV